MPPRRYLFALALLLPALWLASAPAWAQKGGGGGGTPPKGGGTGGRGTPGNPGNNGNNPNNPNNSGVPSWRGSLNEAIESAKTGDNYILVYVHDAKQTQDPPDWSAQDIVAASNNNWRFYKRSFDRDDAEVKSLHVTSAPTLIGMDKYGNEFRRAQAASADAIRAILKAVPDLVKKFAQKLAGDYKKAKDSDDGKEEAKTFALMYPIASLDKKGYKEIDDALAWVVKYGDSKLAQIDAMMDSDEKQAVAKLQAMISEFKNTPPAAGAELRLASIESKRGEIASALARIRRVLKLDGDAYKKLREDAQKQLDALIAEGIKKVDEAQKLASVGETASAREALHKLHDAYKGTEVEKKAAEALKSLEQR